MQGLLATPDEVMLDYMMSGDGVPRRPLAGMLGPFLPFTVPVEGKGLRVAVPPILSDIQDAVMAPLQAYRGELDDPVSSAQNLAGMVTGGGLLVGTPTRQAAAESGQAMLGAGGGYFGGLLDEVPRTKIERMIEIAQGGYNDPVVAIRNKRGAIERSTDLGGSTPSIRPYTSMVSDQVDVGGLLPKQNIDIQEQIGRELIFTPADRTSISKRVKSVDGTPLSEELVTEGGVYYPRRFENWASGGSPMSSAVNRQNTVIKEGSEPIFTTLLMGPRSDIYSSQTSQIAKRVIDNTKISKKDIKAFDDLIKKTYPDWKGIRSKDAEKQLIDDPILRAIFVDKLAGKAAQKAGFPDMSSIRKASTQKEFLGLPDGVVGQSMMLAPTPIQGLRKSTHTTYPLNFDSDDLTYMGSLGFGKIPFEIAAPDLLSPRRARNAPVTSDYRAITMPTAFTRQKITPQYADRISQFIEEGQNLGILF